MLLLFFLVTGRETLRLFGRLRGIHHDILVSEHVK